MRSLLARSTRTRCAERSDRTRSRPPGGRSLRTKPVAASKSSCGSPCVRTTWTTDSATRTARPASPATRGRRARPTAARTTMPGKATIRNRGARKWFREGDHEGADQRRRPRRREHHRPVAPAVTTSQPPIPAIRTAAAYEQQLAAAGQQPQRVRQVAGRQPLRCEICPSSRKRTKRASGTASSPIAALRTSCLRSGRPATQSERTWAPTTNAAKKCA